MIFVVEIETEELGQKQAKSTRCPSMSAAVRALQRDLSRYPNFRVTDMRVQGERETRVSDEAR